MNSLVVSPQIHYIKVLDKTNPPFNEQIWPVPSNFVKLRFDCNIWIKFKFIWESTVKNWGVHCLQWPIPKLGNIYIYCHQSFKGVTSPNTGPKGLLLFAKIYAWHYVSKTTKILHFIHPHLKLCQINCRSAWVTILDG